MEKKSRTTKIIAVLVILMMSLTMCLTGCGNESGDSGSADNDSKDVKTISFTDDCDREVKVPEKIEKVIASGPLAQIFLLAIAPDTLIATNSAWSDDVKKYIDKKYLDLPEVGQFFGNHDLNYEEIAKLSPDVIIDVGESKPTMKSDLEDITEKTNIPAIHIDANVDDLDRAFTRLGELLGREDQASDLAEYCKSAYDKTEKAIKNVDKKAKVMYCTAEDGLNVLAKDSYHSQILDKYADNVAVLDDPSSKGTGNEVNIEQMINWDPDVIIFAPNSYYKFVKEDKAWNTLTAVKNNNYYEVPAGPYDWMGNPPSCNRLLGQIWLIKLLYPDEADYDLKDMVKQYYKLFYQYDLSDDEYDGLVKNSIGKK